MLKTHEEIVKDRYVRNYMLLREKAPSIIAKINNRTNTDWSIRVTPDGKLNALISGQVLYPGDPLAIAKEQVETFRKNPSRLIMPLIPQKVEDENLKYIHDRLQNKIIEGVDTSSLDISFPFDGKTIPLIVVFGMGFGYHVVELIREFNIQHMIVIEPDPLFLNLSLYAIDWREIIDYFSKSVAKSFSFIVSDDPDEIKSELSKIVMAINPAFIVNTFFFEHFSSPFFEEVKEHLKTEHIVNPKLWGVIDSELCILKHAIGVMDKKLPVYYGNKLVDENTPVFIIGNGPSLDNLYEVIKTFSDKALVVSCGTSIKSLYRAGIKPDIYVIADWQDINYQLVEDIKDFLKDVYILSAIVSPPEIPALGKKGGVFLTQINIGSVIFPDYIPRLDYTIPTVVSAAMSLFAHMGFKKFYLLGVDLGSKDPQIHHSSKSDYYTPGSILYNFREEFDIEVEGNFGGTVYSSLSLIYTKKNIEKLIRKFKLDVYNLSDGARIEGSLPIDPKDFSLHNELHKESVVKKIFKNFRRSYLKDVDANRILESMIEDLTTYINLFSSKLRYVNDLKGLVELFSDLHFSLMSLAMSRGIRNNYPLFTLIGSSLYKYEMSILTFAFGSKDRNLISSMSKRFLPVIREYLDITRSELEKLLKSRRK